jgi:hypothetical protein
MNERAMRATIRGLETVLQAYTSRGCDIPVERAREMLAIIQSTTQNESIESKVKRLAGLLRDVADGDK